MIMRVSTAQLRRLVREVLLIEYVSASEQDPNTMAAGPEHRKDILGLLDGLENIPEVGEFLDVISGADRDPNTDPKHDRYFTQNDVDHLVTTLEAEEEAETAKKLKDIDFTEYFI